MQKILPALLLAWCLPASANFAECILDKMPASSNEAATSATYRLCASEHPGLLYDIERGAGRGWFGFKSADECTVKKSQKTVHQRAALIVANACRCLYTPPEFQGEMCSYRPVPASQNPFSKFDD